MADAYWLYGDSQQHSAAAALPALVAKRPRTEYDVPSAHNLASYYAHDDDRSAHPIIRDTNSINASYERYLRRTQMSSYGGGESARSIGSGLSGRPVDDPHVVAMGGPDAAVTATSRSMAVGGERPEIPLPPNASITLFVEGLPANCTRREVSYIFRTFVGYKEVRLVNKESRHPGSDPLVLCFVDFAPAHAATAMEALQGAVDSQTPINLWVIFDEHDHDSVHLRLQFARHPGARSAGGHRGKR